MVEENLGKIIIHIVNNNHYIQPNYRHVLMSFLLVFTDNFEISIDEILAIVKSHSDLSSVPSAVCKKLYRCKSVEKDL